MPVSGSYHSVTLELTLVCDRRKDLDKNQQSYPPAKEDFTSEVGWGREVQLPGFPKTGARDPPRDPVLEHPQGTPFFAFSHARYQLPPLTNWELLPPPLQPAKDLPLTLQPTENLPLLPQHANDRP
ncbi:hypothetical protein DPEC_G00188350 [Dallia pectoralis]|uniref:Uncharacterized protein n=1 Tax=Dallia pectoralis TaxID=75939 RepID=A0ACC2GBX6_DALPE|nr:hypothetical protein DPEC_G00188350 [Dallia pectoralis]